MFGTGKLQVEQKAKRRHSKAFYVIGIFIFAIESMLGLNAAFLLDQSLLILATHMLAGTFLAVAGATIVLVISLVVGACFLLGGMWIFSDFMQSLDNAKSWQEEYATGRWPVGIVWGIAAAVMAVDLTTLLFRASFFVEQGEFAWFAFFIILIPLPLVLGAYLYVQENPPRTRRLARARQYAESLEGDSVETLVQVMDEDLRSRWLSGDATAVDEHYNRVAARIAESQDYEQKQIAAQAAQVQQKQEGDARRKRPLLFAPRHKKQA